MDLISSLIKTNNTKIIVLVIDGIGGLAHPSTGQTALEYASTPNLDILTSEGTTGQILPIDYGITPGSGPAHLSLFGYDAIASQIGRGILEAYGVGMNVSGSDVAVRGNFCTTDQDGNIIDRRAGRISDKIAQPLVELLKEIDIEGVDIELRHVSQHRFVAVFKGNELSDAVYDTDPQVINEKPLLPKPKNLEANRTVEILNHWIDSAEEILGDRKDANMVILRGFSHNPGLRSFIDKYGLNASCIAAYPMYKGIARLVGMEIVENVGKEVYEQFKLAKNVLDDGQSDYLYIHVKETDSCGEDGDYSGKVKIIEEIDKNIKILVEANPSVIVVTGDHSTPSIMSSHSWHPVPLLIWAPETVRIDSNKLFGEESCASGGIGTIKAKYLMNLILAHSQRLKKFGA